MGDGVLAYFGYPQAHEDDAERAVRAGLGTIDAVARLESPESLAVRIGIATGLVVVGDLIGDDAAPSGPSVSSRRAEQSCGRRRDSAAGRKPVRVRGSREAATRWLRRAAACLGDRQ